ncbi:hypothetical protein L1887_62340 [Cichorium endivia]|nr:hypothetical protein L1887_62340 [Cichorium endivia]
MLATWWMRKSNPAHPAHGAQGIYRHSVGNLNFSQLLTRGLERAQHWMQALFVIYATAGSKRGLARRLRRARRASLSHVRGRESHAVAEVRNGGHCVCFALVDMCRSCAGAAAAAIRPRMAGQKQEWRGCEKVTSLHVAQPLERP